MHCTYKDIRERLGEPLWWDEFAVPRYCEFRPSEAANIYAWECCLLEIACQNCGKRFLVCMSWSSWAEIMGKPTPMLAERIRSSVLGYGDPPNAGCCSAGPTMSSDVLRVVEYWARVDFGGWKRNRLYEKTFTEEAD